MSVFSKLAGKVFQVAINKVLGSGLIQEETTASGEKYITPGISEAARKAAAEGCVLLKNEGVLPLDPACTVSVFGRCQLDWIYVGYGSGGDVKAPYYVNLMDALENAGCSYNKELAQLYQAWCLSKEHKADHGWWGHWPTSYPEMPLSKEVVYAAAQKSTTALVVIGRAAGEDRECTLTEGSYYLTATEKEMLDLVTDVFEHTVAIIDTGNVMDLSWTVPYGRKLSAILLAWLGGMESGNAVCDLLYGKETPSGRLTDTIAMRYEDYPSSRYFGNPVANEYKEGIYVGYRHFDKYAKEAVLYPFGFGLSYTAFELSDSSFTNTDGSFTAKCKITNTGNYAGKEVVKLWCYLPDTMPLPTTEAATSSETSGEQHLMDKPVRILAGFAKTPLLAPGESCQIAIESSASYIASYDDALHVFLLDAGTYRFMLNDTDCGSMELAQRKILHKAEPALTKDVHLKERILERLPEEFPANTFIGGLSLQELEALTRGQGMMSSSYGPSGNAGAFGGIIPSLQSKGIAPLITTDGPSGLRLNTYTSLLPCGTALASMWNMELMEELYGLIAKEMRHFGSDILLAPGMNIHRNPLCGRNFEYYSEDPLLSGKTAAAAVKGIQSEGGAACPKHFACNNQETRRNRNDSVVSERALREIYLKNFEICVKEGKPLTIMTSYNKINGIWSHYNYDLVTTVLRKDWGFEGTVITDWWMQRAASPEFPSLKNNAYRVRAQVDVLMPGDMSHIAKKYRSDGTLLKALGKPDGITKAELQRTAANVLRLVHALKK